MALPDINALTKYGDPAQYEQMQSNAAKRNKKTFGTAFLNALTGRMNESRAEAKEWYKEEKQRAQRNLPLVQKREAQKKAITGMATDLKSRYNVDDERLMYFLKDGTDAFNANYQAIKKLELKMANAGLTLDEERVKGLMDLPEEYKPSDQTLTEFINEMYSTADKLNQDAPPKDESSFFDNLVTAAGFGSMSRAERRLAEEKMYGDLSYDDINKMAAMGDTTVDPFGGLFSMASLDASRMPYIMDTRDVSQAMAVFDSKKKTYTSDLNTAKTFITQYNEKRATAGLQPILMDEYAVLNQTRSSRKLKIPGGLNGDLNTAWENYVSELAAKEIVEENPTLRKADAQVRAITRHLPGVDVGEEVKFDNSNTNLNEDFTPVTKTQSELRSEHAQYTSERKAQYTTTAEELKTMIEEKMVKPGDIWYVQDENVFVGI